MAIGINGKDSEFELRRAELVLKGKGPGNIEWVAGYDAKADKFLDANLKYKIGGNGNHYLQVGQFKQPNSMEELSSTKNNDFISKAAVTNTYAVARRLGVGYSYGTSDWSLTASLLRSRVDPQPGPRPWLRPARHLGADQRKGQRPALRPGLRQLRHPSDTFRVRSRPNADLATVRTG